MKVKIKRKRIEYKDVEETIDLPTETRYWFQYGARIAWCCQPNAYENTNEDGSSRGTFSIFSYNFCKVDPDGEVSIFSIPVSNIHSIFENTKSPHWKAASYLVDPPEPREVRTREQFMAEVRGVFEKMIAHLCPPASHLCTDGTENPFRDYNLDGQTNLTPHIFGSEKTD